MSSPFLDGGSKNDNTSYKVCKSMPAKVIKIPNITMYQKLFRINIGNYLIPHLVKQYAMYRHDVNNTPSIFTRS